MLRSSCNFLIISIYFGNFIFNKNSQCKVGMYDSDTGLKTSKRLCLYGYGWYRLIFMLKIHESGWKMYTKNDKR